MGSFNSSTPIEVYVIGQTGKLYDSYRINSGSINLMLAPGQYYLMFNNKFSIITGKDVNAKVYLRGS